MSVGDQDNPHVYIQIGDEQVGMVETEEAEPEDDEMEPGEIPDLPTPGKKPDQKYQDLEVIIVIFQSQC